MGRKTIRRASCMLTALILLVPLVPVAPANATGGVLPLPFPMPPPVYLPPSNGGDNQYIQDMFGVTSEEAAEIVRDAYIAMQTAVRAAGIQYVDTDGNPLTNGQYMISQQGLENAMTAAQAVYNGLDAAGQAAVWLNAQAVAAGQAVLEWESGVLQNIKEKFWSVQPHKMINPEAGILEVSGVDLVTQIHNAPISIASVRSYSNFTHTEFKLIWVPKPFVFYDKGLGNRRIEYMPAGGEQNPTYIGMHVESGALGYIRTEGYAPDGTPSLQIQSYWNNEIDRYYFTPPSQVLDEIPILQPDELTYVPLPPGVLDGIPLVDGVGAINGVPGTDIGRGAAPAIPGTGEGEGEGGLTGEGEGEGTDNPAIPGTGEGTADIPDIGDIRLPEEIPLAEDVPAIDLKPLEKLKAFAGVFPFCIPFDIARIFTSFKAEAKKPKFELKLPLKPKVDAMGDVYYDDVPLVLDLTVMEPIMPMFRFFIWTFFMLGLASFTSKVIKW